MPLVARRGSLNVTDGGGGGGSSSGGGGASLELPTIEDIESRFTELREIGHGSFGAVYYAKDIRTHDVVAIKKMSFSGKQSEEKWQDIVREVRTLSQLHHKHVVEFKGCYLVDSTAWLAMEYCIGSAADLLEVHRKPLREDEISAISASVLEGLDYLHSRSIIHRDIKAANVLLTDLGFVKIGDFGSASLSSPANSFLGTPYWMAPEVILAMDDGNYDGRADIWSLGITCIEMSELKPPLFNVNSMSALYHIAQNPPPTLASTSDWSAEYRNFVTSCLQKDATSRPSASALLNYDAFISRSADGRCHPVVLDLVRRTKHEVREVDKQNGKRIRKILMAEESATPCIVLPDADGSDDVVGGRARHSSSPTASLTAYGDDRGNGRCDSGGGWPGDDSSLDAQSMGGMSAASSISSRDICRSELLGTSTPTKYASSPISVRRQPLKISVSMPGSNSTLEPPGSNLSTVVRREPSRSGKKAHDADAHSSLSSASHHNTGGPGSFATIRPSSVVEKQRKVYAGDSTTVEQMALYKRMRRQHQLQLLQLEQKYRLELLDHQNRLDKESEVLESAYEKDVEKLRTRRENELAKKAKQTVSEDQQATSKLKKQQKQELEAYTKEVQKAAKQRADLRKLQEHGDSGKHRDTLTRSDKDSAQAYIQDAVDAKIAEQNHEATVQLRRVQRSKMIEYYQLEQSLLKEEFGRMQIHLENQHEMSLRHHSSALELEQRQLAGLQRARAEQMAQQHSAELHNQKQYMDKCERDMKKRHLLNTKRLPQSLKDKEAELKKQFQEEVRTQDRLYKAQKEKLIASPSPSANSLRSSGSSSGGSSSASATKEAVRRLREEYDRRVSAMYTQYQQSLADMLQQQTERVDESHVAETEELRARLQDEYKQLTSYQENMRAQMDALHGRERDDLQRTIANRKTAIDRRREEDSVDYVQRRSTAMGELRDKHAKQLEAFDRETKALGIADDVDNPKSSAMALPPSCHQLVETPVREPGDRSRSMYLNHRVSASVTSGGRDSSPVRFSTHL